ncbi:hypothetical protein J3F83DRAFT_749708 [Trichoderma novae-zelandiae]
MMVSFDSVLLLAIFKQVFLSLCRCVFYSLRLRDSICSACLIVTPASPVNYDGDGGFGSITTQATTWQLPFRNS